MALDTPVMALDTPVMALDTPVMDHPVSREMGRRHSAVQRMTVL